MVFKKLFLAAAVLVGCVAPAQAVVVFSDNFDADTRGNRRTSLINWTATVGNVDILGVGGGANPYVGYGRYVEMAGSNPGSGVGRIETRTSFNIVSGTTYTIKFDLGVDGTTAETLRFGIGSIFQTINIAAGGIGPGMLTKTFTFLAASNQSNVKLFFQTFGANNRGPIVDNVSLSAVPIPGAAMLLLSGLAGVAGLGRMRGRRVAV